MLLLIVAALSAGLLLSGCSSSSAQVSTVDAAEFQSVASGVGTQVIDVRTPAEFAAGHLDGAVNIDVEGPDFAAQVATLDKDATYAVYCRSGNRSKSATQQMADAGIGSIYELGGGINAWAAAGYPIVQ
jgi:rhodanese-related sulfurtransferase